MVVQLIKHLLKGKRRRWWIGEEGVGCWPGDEYLIGSGILLFVWKHGANDPEMGSQFYWRAVNLMIHFRSCLGPR